MTFKECSIKTEYRSLLDDVVREFYIPLLSSAVEYQRSVGFFSSTALVEISKGIATLAKNGGHIKLVASPYLSDEDIKAIQKGYEERSIIENALMRELEYKVEDYYSIERLNLLANLIADGILDIRIAYTENIDGVGMYHEKMGLMRDSENNVVAFSGSMNESRAAMITNYETIDVFCNWEGKSDYQRVQLKENAFQAIWNNCEPNIRVVEFPKVNKAFVEKFKNKAPNYNIDIEQFNDELLDNKINVKGARVPESIHLYDYQLEAINNWKNNGYRGIFDMATGTGKTLTGLGALSRLSQDLNDELAVIIVCPYQHLVEQWVEDINKFNINPIIGYSKSSQKDWKKRLLKSIQWQNFMPDDKFFCFITTNSTFASKYVQDALSKIRKPILFIADEAHNLGTERFLSLLDEKYKYRLALSATLERHFDDIGTSKLCDFFGEKCIEYGLERAIAEGKLTPYKYFPVLVTLNEEELQKFNELGDEISRHVIVNKSGNVKLDEYGKRLAIKRSRIVAAAYNKIEALKTTITPFKGSNNMLVYCGATKVENFDKDYSDVDTEGLRQIEVITKLLGLELGIKVSKFTADENIYERNAIKEHFIKNDIQAIVAIKCLDEGVNIPAIQKAFILASTTNPKEYIQRRGRVLRLSSETGKRFAEIYDFITLPRAIDETYGLTLEQVKREASLARSEVKRMKEFSELSLNPEASYQLLDDIMEAYGLYESLLGGINDGI